MAMDDRLKTLSNDFKKDKRLFGKCLRGLELCFDDIHCRDRFIEELEALAEFYKNVRFDKVINIWWIRGTIEFQTPEYTDAISKYYLTNRQVDKIRLRKHRSSGCYIVKLPKPIKIED